MKKYFILAAAALAFAACSNDEIVPQEQVQQVVDDGAVRFDVYTQRGVTRGGVAAPVTTADLKNDATLIGAAGFGVFGYYTDNNDYDQRNTPNFFYNQQVYYKAGSFTYSPLKYWPNEYGDKAISDDADKVTYFAYAPWVEVIPTSGKLKDTSDNAEQWGITGMTRNNNQGDPILKYIGSFDSKYSIDLCWGVVDNGDTNWDIVQTGTVQNSPDMEAGKPWLNVYRPAGVDQKVRFTFKHATAQMRVNIDADVDITDRTHSNNVSNKTRVWVRQVTFTGFAMKGALNLNNEDPYKPHWLDYNGQNDIVSEDFVVYDGRKDGKEGVSGSVASNEKSVGLNPTLVQDGVYARTPAYISAHPDDDIYIDNNMQVVGADGNKRAGVTKNPVNLFNSTADPANDLFYVIPTDDKVTIEIVYDIETVDGNLSTNLSDGQTKGSSIENRISNKIYIDGDQLQLQAGHSYAINLHLGMNSVKFDAAVTDWIEEPTQDVDLPANTPLFTAGNTSATPHSVDLPYSGNYTFAITGLNGGESMTQAALRYYVSEGGVAKNSSGISGQFSGWSATQANASTSGVAVQTLTTVPNPNTVSRTQQWDWTGTQSSKLTSMSFTQAAHPLFMKINTKDAAIPTVKNDYYIYLTRYNDANYASSTDWTQNYGWLCAPNGASITTPGANGNPEEGENGVAVYRNGIKLVFEGNAAAPTNANGFVFYDNCGGGVGNNVLGQIRIGELLQVGDVIKVVIKTGNAPVETATYTIKD